MRPAAFLWNTFYKYLITSNKLKVYHKNTLKLEKIKQIIQKNTQNKTKGKETCEWFKIIIKNLEKRYVFKLHVKKQQQ